MGQSMWSLNYWRIPPLDGRSMAAVDLLCFYRTGPTAPAGTPDAAGADRVRRGGRGGHLCHLALRAIESSRSDEL